MVVKARACVFASSPNVHTRVLRVICGCVCVCVWILWVVSLQLPHQQGCTERGEGREARLMSNSSAWIFSSFLTEPTETERGKFNSCCAAYSHTEVEFDEIFSFSSQFSLLHSCSHLSLLFFGTFGEWFDVRTDPIKRACLCVSPCSTLARPSLRWAPSGSSCTCTTWPAKARRLCCSPRAPGFENCRTFSRWAWLIIDQVGGVEIGVF